VRSIAEATLPRKLPLAALILLGASLPLIAGAWESHGARRRCERAWADRAATDFSKTEEARTSPAAAPPRRRA
jgi:hypothetical protein